MRMNYSEDSKISFANPVFDVTRNTLNATMQNLVDEMVEKGMNSGSVALKISFNIESVVINDDNAQMGTRPAMCVVIGTDIAYSMQQKGSVKIGGMSKVADLRYRPMFTDWRISLTVSLIDVGVFTMESIINAINLGGYMGGIGEWRMERDGDFGHYHVEIDGERV